MIKKKNENHSERKHSKFSASGAERYFNCPGSVALSEGRPDKDSPWSLEGTLAHEVLETQLKGGIENGGLRFGKVMPTEKITREMITCGLNTANFVFDLFDSLPGAEVMVETRVHLDFIHPEMFGTFDAAVVDYFGMLHVFDYKFGKGHAVSPKENLQMIFYGMGLAAQYQWNFHSVRLWIDQPRIKGYDGPVFWDVSMEELKGRYVSEFKKAVKRVIQEPERYVEGQHCHWCKAKAVCPLKTEVKKNKARELFKNSPIEF